MTTQTEAMPHPAPDPDHPLPSKAGPATWWKAAHHTVTVTGLASMCALALLFFKPHLSEHVKDLSPFSTDEMLAESEMQEVDLMEVSAESPAPKPVSASAASYAIGYTPSVDAAPKMLPLLATSSKSQSPKVTPEQQRVAQWLARRYRVATDATQMMVNATYSIANEIKLDPLLVLAVMAIESRFNPFAESPVGAQGLMQVMSKIHHKKFEELGGVRAALNPQANIRVGSQILKEYVRRNGSVEAGLKQYVGAAAFETDFGYGSKVLAEYRRLQSVAGGQKVSVHATTPKKAVVKPAPKPVEVMEEAPILEAEIFVTDATDLPA